MKRKVIKIEMLSHADPEQWKGELDTGEEFFAWCRYGLGQLEIPRGIPVASVEYEDPLHGYFEPGDLKILFTEAGIFLDEDILTTSTDL